MQLTQKNSCLLVGIGLGESGNTKGLTGKFQGGKLSCLHSHVCLTLVDSGNFLEFCAGVNGAFNTWFQLKCML